MNDNDGWRLQVHKDNLRVALLSKNGHDYTDRLPTISAAVSRIAATSLIFEAELTASGADGIPDFLRLRFRKTVSAALCVWAFDLLYIDGVDMRAQPLVGRKERLRALITGDPALRFSEGFDDGTRLHRSRDNSCRARLRRHIDFLRRPSACGSNASSRIAMHRTDGPGAGG